MVALPEIMDLTLFGKTLSVRNNKFFAFRPIHSGSELFPSCAALSWFKRVSELQALPFGGLQAARCLLTDQKARLVATPNRRGSPGGPPLPPGAV